MDKKLVYVTIFSATWALNIFLNKLALNNGVNAISYTLQASFLSVIIINIYLFNKKGLKIIIESKKHIYRLISLGLSVGAAYVLGIYGLKYSTSINYGFLIKSTLLFTTLLAWMFLNESFTKRKTLLVILFTVGSYLIATSGQLIIPHLGDLLIIFAAFFFSLALIITKPLTKKIDADLIGGYRLTFSFLVMLILIPLFSVNIFEISQITNVVMVGFSTAILAVYLNKTLSVSSASYLTMMSMMTPIIVSLLGLVVLKESMNGFQIIGAILTVFCGVLVYKFKM